MCGDSKQNRLPCGKTSKTSVFFTEKLIRVIRMTNKRIDSEAGDVVWMAVGVWKGMCLGAVLLQLGSVQRSGPQVWKASAG